MATPLALRRRLLASLIIAPLVGVLPESAAENATATVMMAIADICKARRWEREAIDASFARLTRRLWSAA